MSYVGKCKTCENLGNHREYHGETARNLYNRSKEHLRDLKKKKSTSWMNKHIINEHEGKEENAKFEWKITGKYDKPLPRQISEALAIDKKSTKENLNSKREFNGQSVKE